MHDLTTLTTANLTCASTCAVDERLTRVLINGADLVKRPDPPLSNRRAGTCHDATGVVRHDHLTNAMACRLVRCPPIHRETKKAPGVPGLSRSLIANISGSRCPRRPDTIPKHKSGKAQIAEAPRPPGTRNRRPGLATTHAGDGARHDQLTNAALSRAAGPGFFSDAAGALISTK